MDSVVAGHDSVLVLLFPDGLAACGFLRLLLFGLLGGHGEREERGKREGTMTWHEKVTKHPLVKIIRN
jgi:hypothetical protein